jgi:hypothetical protein
MQPLRSGDCEASYEMVWFPVTFHLTRSRTMWWHPRCPTAGSGDSGSGSGGTSRSRSHDWRPPQRVRALVIPGPLAGETIWYEDSARKQLHQDMVLAGMERARQRGQHIGRPQVSERPQFEQRFTDVVERIRSGSISRSQAARELGIG